jgi:hypothetical protein
LNRQAHITVIAILACVPPGGFSAGADDGVAMADPFAVVATLDGFAKSPLWPGFDPTVHPVAIYDGERTLLLRHPDPPEEFAPLEGHEGVWVATGRHVAMRWNSNVDLGGVRTATLLLTIQPGRKVDQEAGILLHEVFHAFSKPRHPTWKPDEMQRYGYPLDDVENHTLLLLEEEALARALEADEDAVAAGWAAAALGWRRERTRALADGHLNYETALEMQEGTAVYVARLALGTFRETKRLRETRSPDQLRWRFYDTGAALAALLDLLDPSWKRRLEEEPGIGMDALLGEALRRRGTAPAELPASERASIRAAAEAAVTEWRASRARLRQDFLSRSPRLVVSVPDGMEPLRLRSFDPLALEILDGGEALHPHRLTLEAGAGRIEVDNPRFQRGSLQGVVSLTVPAGAHPFLDGVSRVTVTGFAGKPEIRREGGGITVEAEGLRLTFQRASIRTAGEELRILLKPPEPSGR